MKLLNGLEIAEYIQERQAKQVRALRQAHGIAPKLVVIHTDSSTESDSFLKLYQNYAKEISVDLELIDVEKSKAAEEIAKYNGDSSTHGIVVQLPLSENSQTDEVLNAVDPRKDVAGLGEETIYDTPTPLAIDWLLSGYNVDLRGKNIVIIGQDRMIGLPLAKRWQNSGLNITVAHKNTPDIEETLREADVLVSATGVPGLITKDMVKPNAVIVDAGVATDKNGLVGDVAASVRELPNITITPEKGGVEPLTVCALFDNVIRSAGQTAK